MSVIKRDGRIEAFNVEKIVNAARKAYHVCNAELSEDVEKQLRGLFTDKDTIGIEEIQDAVEKILMKDNPEFAKAFIIYRYKHKRIRDFVNNKLKFIDIYKKSDNTANATIDDNSNVATHNIAVLNSEIHKEDNQQINLKMLENKVRELYPDFNYKQMLEDFNSIAYLHDSSSQIGMPYCVAITMYPFLINGIKDIGGLSAAPKNIDSFCGMFVNLVFAIASQFKGACMYKNQKLLINEDNVGKIYTSKELVEKYLINSYKFSNYQGDWEVAIVPEGVKVLEDNKLVSVKKVYRRKYKDKIYKINTKDGHQALVSKDHIFKQLFHGRHLEIKAEQLKELDTVHTNYDYSFVLNYDSYDFKKGWVIGMLCGDGCLTQPNKVGLSVNYEQEWLGNLFNEYSNLVFGYTLNQNKGHKCYNYQKYNAEFAENIHKEILGNTTYDKHIELEGKSLDFIAGFLDGIFCADGSYSQGHGITIALTNKALAENIQQAVSLFGIKSHLCIVPPRRGRKESYQQYISSKILKYVKHCHNKILSKDCINIETSSEETYWYGYNSFQCRTLSNKRNKWSNSKQPVIYKTDVIESIETFDNDDDYVYEIETASHWYNCGGFITHNCATPGMLLCMDWFLRKEWGDEYYLKSDIVISSEWSSRRTTIQHQIHQYFQQIVYSLMQPSGSRGNQSVFWNLSIFDKPFFETMYGDFIFPDGTQPKWESLQWLQKEFMHWFNQERLKVVLTFPVVSLCLIYQDNRFLDEDLAEFAAQEYAQGNSFFTYISDSADSLSSCCRLSSKLAKPQFNFTNGQLSEMTGSKNVITLNLNRIIQDCCRENGGNPKYISYKHIKPYLIKVLDRIYKYQTAYNAWLIDLYNANLLSVYNAGFIDLKKQYLTIGINGLNQAAEFLGIKCNKNREYQGFCNLIFSTIKEQNILHGTKELMFNTEFTPCESASIKLYNRDKKDGYWVPEDTNLYASYIFKPNDAEISVLDKLYLHGNAFCGDMLDGGSAAHINLDHHLDVDQYRKILKYAAEVGCKYFTFNIPNCECEKCGFIAKQPFTKCPKCGDSEHIVLWDRIIGYLTKINNWSAGRQIEQKTRVYSKDVKI